MIINISVSQAMSSFLAHLGLTTPDDKPLRKVLQEGDDYRYGWRQLLVEEVSGDLWVVTPTETVEPFVPRHCPNINSLPAPRRGYCDCGCIFFKQRCSVCGGMPNCNCFGSSYPGTLVHVVNNQKIFINTLGQSWAHESYGRGRWLGIFNPLTYTFTPAPEPRYW